MGGKLTIIGGGSAWTPDLVADLLAEPHLWDGWEWVLHDVDVAAAQTVATLARVMVRAAGAGVAVRVTADRQEALAGARFVLIQARPGGLHHRHLDESIPLRHGVIGQETVGPGGFAFAWRSIPLVLAILDEVARLCPGAWVVSYTNPAGMVAEAVVRTRPHARFLALCDMPWGLRAEVARLLRVPPARVELEYRGINHAGWVARVLVDGQDAWPRLLRWVRWLPVRWLPLSEWTGAIRLAQDHGLLGDPYLRYYYYQAEALAHLRRRRRTRAQEVMGRVQRLYRHFAHLAQAGQPRLRLHRGHASVGDLAAALFRALAAGRPFRCVIQQRNPGHLLGLPPGRAAQFPAVVTPTGWDPLPVPPLPEPQGELIRRIQDAEAVNVSATLAGDRRLAVEAMALNPLVPSRAVAERLVEELLAAHRGYVPTFTG